MAFIEEMAEQPRVLQELLTHWPGQSDVLRHNVAKAAGKPVVFWEWVVRILLASMEHGY